MRVDGGIHQRLGERGLVAFVVAEAAVAEHVDDHRPAEALAVFGRDLGDVDHGLRVVAVDVEHRRLDHLGDVGRIGRGARRHRRRREADLVVDDEVDRAAGAVTLQAGQAEAFGDHALAGEGRVAVQQQRQHLGAVGLARRHETAVDSALLILLGPGLAEHHRIDDLEVAGVGGQGQMHLVAVELAVGGGAEVVLDVARTFDVRRVEGAALEFVEQRAMRLLHHLGQDVQPAAMGHAEYDILHAQGTATLDDLFERRDQRFAAIKAEALGAGILDVEKLLEAFGLDELVEDRLLAFGGEADFLVGAFHVLLDPGLGHRIGDVHEFDADGRAIGALEQRQHLGEGRELKTEIVIEEDLAAVIGGGEAIGRRIEFGRRVVGLELQRVEIGVQMAAHAVGADHHDGADRIARRLMHVLKLDRGTGDLGLLLQRLAGAHGDFGGGPVAVEGGHQFAIGDLRPVLALPGGALGVGGRLGARVLELAEIADPGGVDAGGIGFEAGVEFVNIGGVAAIQERSEQELFVLFLSCHDVLLRSLRAPASLHRSRRRPGLRGASITA